MKPLLDRVIIKELKERVTQGGVVIPGAEWGVKTSGVTRGVVLAVGPGRMTEKWGLIKTIVNPDDVVLFVKDSGTTIKQDDEEFIIISEQAILAVLDKSELDRYATDKQTKEEAQALWEERQKYKHITSKI